MKGRWVALGVLAAALAILAGRLLGDGPSAVRAQRAQPSAAVEPSTRSMPYSLLTYCGIDAARIDRTYFEADQPLVGPAVRRPVGRARTSSGR